MTKQSLSEDGLLRCARKDSTVPSGIFIVSAVQHLPLSHKERGARKTYFPSTEKAKSTFPAIPPSWL